MLEKREKEKANAGVLNMYLLLFHIIHFVIFFDRFKSDFYITLERSVQ